MLRRDFMKLASGIVVLGPSALGGWMRRLSSPIPEPVTASDVGLTPDEEFHNTMQRIHEALHRAYLEATEEAVRADAELARSASAVGDARTPFDVIGRTLDRFDVTMREELGASTPEELQAKRFLLTREPW